MKKWECWWWRHPQRRPLCSEKISPLFSSELQLLSWQREAFEVRTKKDLRHSLPRFSVSKLPYNLPTLQTPKLVEVSNLRSVLLGLPRIASALKDLSYAIMRKKSSNPTWAPVHVGLCFRSVPKMLCCHPAMSSNPELLSALGPCCNKEAKNCLFLEYLVGKGCLQAAYIGSAVLFLSCVLKEKWQCSFSVDKSMEIFSLGGLQAVDTAHRTMPPASGGSRGKASERGKAEDVTLLSAPLHVTTGISYFRGLSSQIFHFAGVLVSTVEFRISLQRPRWWKIDQGKTLQY